MDMSLSQAASAVHLTKQGLLNAINKGRLAASKDANGQWRIDSAELMRVYPAAKSMTATPSKNLTPGGGDITTELAVAKAQLEAERRRADNAERERDAWRSQAETLLRALPAGRPTTPPETSAPIPMPAVEKAEIRPIQAPEGEIRPEVREEAEKPRRRGFWASIFRP